jgi:hypothetical protein
MSAEPGASIERSCVDATLPRFEPDLRPAGRPAAGALPGRPATMSLIAIAEALLAATTIIALFAMGYIARGEPPHQTTCCRGPERDGLDPDVKIPDDPSELFALR